MFVTSFYSFKGGTGRTQGLVNVAAQLANSGSRVLVVDFDLEAPGIDTFDITAPPPRQPGLVDYVNEYLTTGNVPAVKRFVFKAAGIGEGDGGLWVMPAGRIDADYAANLTSIDWHHLYSERNGYALLENLKKQWEQLIAPDYVLIDSRTGHTDIRGICTRQLPDLVVLFFFPNEQNLRGIVGAVREIRHEAETPRKKIIDMHFVMSNVPDLDDEKGILKEFVLKCRQELGLEEEPARIHHYPSLDLLTSEVFTLKHANSRLAAQYTELTRAIQRHNLDDPEGAISYLQQALRSLRRSKDRIKGPDFVDALRRIRHAHKTDHRILLRIGEAYHTLGQTSDAAATYDQIEAMGYGEPRVWIAQAETHSEAGETNEAVDAIQRLLNAAEVKDYQVNFAVGLLARVRPSALPGIAQAPAVRSLDAEGRRWVAEKMSETEGGLRPAQRLLTDIMASPDAAASLRATARDGLILNHIALGEFAEAIRLLAPDGHAPQAQIGDVFNFAIARWGMEGRPDRKLFSRVLDIHAETDDPRSDPNYLQCLSLAAWASGREQEAGAILGRARQEVLTTPRPVFSCWRFMTVTLKAFLDDLDEMSRLYSGEQMLPLFMRAQAHSPQASRHDGA